MDKIKSWMQQDIIDLFAYPKDSNNYQLVV
jgi:hypothetical protein